MLTDKQRGHNEHSVFVQASTMAGRETKRGETTQIRASVSPVSPCVTPFVAPFLVVTH